MALGALMAALAGCALPSEYQVSRAGWEAIEAAPHRLGAVDGAHLREIAGQAYWIRPATTERGEAAYAVTPATRGEGLYVLRPVPKALRGQGRAPDDALVIDEVARDEAWRHAAVVARTPGGQQVNLLPESLPRDVPPGKEPWVPATASGVTASPAVGASLVVSAIPLLYLGIGSLASPDCGSNICGVNTIGKIITTLAASMVAGGATFIVVGYLEHNERVHDGDRQQRVLLGEPPPPASVPRPTPTPPSPPSQPPGPEPTPSTPSNKTPLGVLPAAQSIGFTLEF